MPRSNNENKYCKLGGYILLGSGMNTDLCNLWLLDSVILNAKVREVAVRIESSNTKTQWSCLSKLSGYNGWEG